MGKTELGEQCKASLIDLITKSVESSAVSLESTKREREPEEIKGAGTQTEATGV